MDTLYKVGQTINNTQYGTLKCLEINTSNEDFHKHTGRYEVLEHKTTFIWEEDKGNYREAVIYPVGTVIVLEGDQYFGE